MRLLIALLLAGALMAGCTGYAASGSGESTDSGAGTSVQPSGKTVEITVTAKNWEFDPSVIKVKKGDTVRLNLHSIEGTHGFSLPEFRINEKLVAGEPPKTVEFVADKAGEFGFRCSVMCGMGHMNQKGILIVEE
jgi:cytochrome c oxidase subunit 2